jgi:hypothetical protein
MGDARRFYIVDIESLEQLRNSGFCVNNLVVAYTLLPASCYTHTVIRASMIKIFPPKIAYIHYWLVG